MKIQGARPPAPRCRWPCQRCCSEYGQFIISIGCSRIIGRFCKFNNFQNVYYKDKLVKTVSNESNCMSFSNFINGNTMVDISDRGVQEPEYRSRLRQELAFFSRSQSSTGSEIFLLEQDPEQE